MSPLNIARGFILVAVVTVMPTCGNTFSEIDKRYQGYRSENILGFYGCAKTCAREGRCQSINYNPDLLVCELVDTSTEEVNTSLEWTHTDNFSFVQDRLGSCDNVSIPELSVCIPLSSGNHAIIKQYCEKAQIPSHAYLVSNETKVGTIVDFSCENGYIGVGENSIGCLANGQWSTHNFQCIDCGQPPNVSSATVQPGATTIGSVRNYICDGYDTVSPPVTCQDTGLWTIPDFVCEWPFGTYSLLQPLTGCPAHFEPGSRTWHTEDIAENEMTQDTNLRGFASGAFVEWHFCTMTDGNVSSMEYDWPPGDYCIMRYGGNCPSDFDEGIIYWDEEDDDDADRPMFGVMPDGMFGINSRIYFCCRFDGNVKEPVTLPISRPFVLFRNIGDECQSVLNMKSRKEYTLFEDETYSNKDSDNGYAPKRQGPPNWKIHHCYYEQAVGVK